MGISKVYRHPVSHLHLCLFPHSLTFPFSSFQSVHTFFFPLNPNPAAFLLSLSKPNTVSSECVSCQGKQQLLHWQWSALSKLCQVSIAGTRQQYASSSVLSCSHSEGCPGALICENWLNIDLSQSGTYSAGPKDDMEVSIRRTDAQIAYKELVWGQ